MYLSIERRANDRSSYQYTYYRNHRKKDVSLHEISWKALRAKANLSFILIIRGVTRGKYRGKGKKNGGNEEKVSEKEQKWGGREK